jgi:hypothetical protein
MAKRVFLAHRWGGTPNDDWYPWIKKELEFRGFEVIIPELPNTEFPLIEEWVPALEKVVGKADKDTYFIGHSIGCQAIMRYLETINVPVGGVLFVAGWLSLQELETQEEKDVAEPWLTTPIDFDKVKLMANKITALFTLDDPYVPISDAVIFREKLAARTITEKNRGHYNEEKYEIILTEFLKLTNQ